MKPSIHDMYNEYAYQWRQCIKENNCHTEPKFHKTFDTINMTSAFQTKILSTAYINTYNQKHWTILKQIFPY